LGETQSETSTLLAAVRHDVLPDVGPWIENLQQERLSRTDALYFAVTIFSASP
jgi:hypothetical protein